MYIYIYIYILYISVYYYNIYNIIYIEKRSQHLNYLKMPETEKHGKMCLLTVIVKQFVLLLSIRVIDHSISML